VAQQDWRYRCVFPKPEEEFEAAALRFSCLDTACEVFLNGERIAASQSYYLPFRVDVTGKLRPENVLEIFFQSPYGYLSEHPLKPEWGGRVRASRVMRKPPGDFSDYLGARPYLTPVGVAGDVVLSLAGKSEIVHMDVDASLTDDFAMGSVAVRLNLRPAGALAARAGR